MEIKELVEKLEQTKTALEAKAKADATEAAKAEMALQMKAIDEKIAAINQLPTDLKAEDLKKFIEDVKTLTTDFDALQLKMKQGGGKLPEEQLENVIKENKAALVNIAKRKNSTEFEVKANVLRASIATNEHMLQLDGVGQFGRKRTTLYDVFTKIPVSKGNHNGTITYLDWDEATVIKAAAMVAEGAAFPESTAAFKMYTLPLRKVGDTLPVSEEFFEDEQMAAAELKLFVDANVKSKIGDQVVNGDNTGQNLKGLVTTVTAFAPAASGIVDANIYDLIIKVMESITADNGSKYSPDFVAMNIIDINKLKLKKDASNNYIFNRMDGRIDQLNIVEDNHIASNTMVIGDSRFARIYEMGGVVLSEGDINAQFTSDLMTIKARKRLAFLIREADKTGFKKVTSISAALTTLAT